MSAQLRRRRRWLVLALSGIIVVVSAIAFCIPIYAPPTDGYDLRRVDAVFILGPPTADRIAVGEHLAREAGNVPVYLSVWSGVECKARFVCVHARPWTTAGEAAALDAAIRTDGIRHPIVVTSRVHVTRARYIFDRCVPTNPPVIGVSHARPWWDVVRQPVYQWGAMIKAVIVGCADPG
jgi:hypothetical protein